MQLEINVAIHQVIVSGKLNGTIIHHANICYSCVHGLNGNTMQYVIGYEKYPITYYFFIYKPFFGLKATLYYILIILCDLGRLFSFVKIWQKCYIILNKQSLRKSLHMVI